MTKLHHIKPCHKFTGVILSVLTTDFVYRMTASDWPGMPVIYHCTQYKSMYTTCYSMYALRASVVG